MADDLVMKLRDCYARRSLPTWGEIYDAADEIERLRNVIANREDLCGELTVKLLALENKLAHCVNFQGAALMKSIG